MQKIFRMSVVSSLTNTMQSFQVLPVSGYHALLCYLRIMQYLGKRIAKKSN